MALCVKNLSPLYLKGLKSGDKIIIRYAQSQQEVDENASRIIYEGFSKNVATAFSPAWAKSFPAVNKMTLAQLSSQSTCKAVTIVGGSVEDALAILKWMLSCCEGKGFQEFPFPAQKPFSKYFTTKKSADIMGITILSNEMTLRLNNIAARQVHSEDVRAMYGLLPPTDPLLQEIAARTAELIRTHQLRAFGAYQIVRKDIPAFDQAIEAILGPRKTPEQKLKEAEARNHACTRHAPQRRQFHPTPRPPFVPRTKPQQKPAHVEPPVQHKTIHCPVTRKAAGGRPTYVALPLGEIGVTKLDFTGPRFPLRGNARRTARGGPAGKFVELGANVKADAKATVSGGQSKGHGVGTLAKASASALDVLATQ